MSGDRSSGYEEAARRFIAGRSREIGVPEIEQWARVLSPGAAILDLGCGHGDPVARVLVESGFDLYGIDASPSLVAEFQRRFPDSMVRCEDVRTSDLFGREFDGVIAIGLLFLFDPAGQRDLLRKMARTLAPGGRVLFTAPAVECTWEDVQTGQASRSLGAEAYGDILARDGLERVAEFDDSGGNHYYEARRPMAGGA